MQRVFQIFILLHLAAGKLPFERHGLIFCPLADEYLSFAEDDRGNHLFDFVHAFYPIIFVMHTRSAMRHGDTTRWGTSFSGIIGLYKHDRWRGPFAPSHQDQEKSSASGWE